MNDVVIKVENLGKRYRIGAREKADRTFREVLMDIVASPFRRIQRLGRAAPPEETIWALKDVSLEVRRGEVLGIIGRNGAGKSTLLKILTRITEPTEGRVEIRGRVASLLEVGTGFHPELTGRENIYLNGAVLGMTGKEIQRKFDEIVDFAEIEKFIDTPVKRYSSGMYVRLAFAVAAHLEPEILLVDEVLAVGDVAFRKKCLGKMSEVSTGGRTVVFVSHNMPAVTNLCRRAAWLDEGKVVLVGEGDRAVAEYLNRAQSACKPEVDLHEHAGRAPRSTPTLRHLWMTDKNGRPTASFRMGDPMVLSVRFDGSHRFTSANLGFGFNDPYGKRIFTLISSYCPEFEPPAGVNAGIIRCTIRSLPLCAGTYTVTLGIADVATDLDWIDAAGRFEVLPQDVYRSGEIPKPSQGAVYLKDFLFQFEGDGSLRL